LKALLRAGIKGFIILKIPPEVLKNKKPLVVTPRVSKAYRFTKRTTSFSF
jgi:hypothetical protein